MRLNRTMSASIRRNAGRTRLRRWAKTVSNDEPFHSRPVTSSATLKLMSLGLVATPEVVEQPDEPGIVALVVDEEPRVDVERAVGEVHRDGVGVAPGPGVGLEHGDVVPTERRWAQTSPETPVPTIAILICPACSLIVPVVADGYSEEPTDRDDADRKPQVDHYICC